ncbi:NAD(P)/FAD-dependent oxidoreductase [Streptomyces beijiangensis]|uniref:FAD-dependent oxidoreductase n=1 Tax=Streptomyces beijiangensis TaxID=163361 RepID=A0A939F9R8_9ACTN|nr:FAD-dependent oxidoreductase [Streptomyces beijiangensis]MBO0514346.1 FAD-dependent oxidoreductase [Streptomyces beijiangensis]
MSSRKSSRTVAVIGGGYGGAAVAKALDAETDVILIDPKDAFVHAAGSLRALVRPGWAGNIFFPYDNLLQRGRVVRERAVAVDTEGVTLASGERIAADYLVLATGSGYPFPAKMDTDSSDEALERLHATHEELAGAERVLIVGAGPVGLELSGEIKAVWPEKDVVVVDPAAQLMPTFTQELRDELRRQLDALGVELLLSTALAEEPPTEPGRTKAFSVRTTGGGEIAADLWFRCYGVSVNGDFLADGGIAQRTPQGQVRVTGTLNVEGHRHIYALGDITALAEAKMAGYAMKHAEVVAANIIAQVRGEEPAATYEPSAIPSVLLPLGPSGGVGQVPTPEGPSILPAEAVAQYKGADLFTGRFVELFGLTRPTP